MIKVKLVFNGQFTGKASTEVWLPNISENTIKEAFQKELGVEYDNNCHYVVLSMKRCLSKETHKQETDLIDRDGLLNELMDVGADDLIINRVKSAKSQDKERHAHWIDDGIDYRGANWFKCSNCGRTVCEHYNNIVDEEYPYCYCGCKMDKT